MAAEYSSVDQVVSANQPVVFTNAPVPCSEGIIFHRDGTGIFLLSSRGLRPYRDMCKVVVPQALYEVAFHANVQIPEGGEVGTITLALVVDGEVEPAAVMSVTPAAVEEPFNIGTASIVNVPAICGCSRVSVRNIGDADVEVLSANIIFNRAGVQR